MNSKQNFNKFPDEKKKNSTKKNNKLFDFDFEIQQQLFN